MSIASEITRIQTAKENIKTSIINKGGTLASNALLSDYAAAIDAIPTSGGSIVPISEGVLIYEGTFTQTTSTFAITTLPNGQSFSFDKIIIEISNLGAGINSGWRQYWRSELPMTGNPTYMFNTGVGYLSGATGLKVKTIMEMVDNNFIEVSSFGYDVNDITKTKSTYERKAHDGYNKITAYGWWSWTCPAGAHIKIMGYNHNSPPQLETLTIDTLTQSGTFTPAYGYSQVTIEENWDGSLVPDENDTGFFHCHVINLLATDTLVIDGYGTGYRWVSIKSGQPEFVYWGQQFGTGDQNADAVHCRIYLVPTTDTTVVIGGPAWGTDGSVTTSNYSFNGEYLHWKVIHNATSAQE